MTAALAALAASLLTSGCLYTRSSTNTSRSATEQLLISESIRRAVAELSLPEVGDRGAAVRVEAVPTQDTAYLKAALEARLGLAGARIVPEDQAEVVVVALVGAIGTVFRGASFGLPRLPIPSIGFTPEIPFLASVRQRAWTQAQLVTRNRSGTLVALSDPVLTQARFDVTSVLFFEIRRNDVYPGENGRVAID